MLNILNLTFYTIYFMFYILFVFYLTPIALNKPNDAAPIITPARTTPQTIANTLFLKSKSSKKGEKKLE